MKAFEEYLYKQGYHQNTVIGYRNKVKQFFAWCKLAEINPDTADHEDLYDYQSSCRRDGNAPSTILEKILAVKLYYFFLDRKPNPALLVVTERSEKKLPGNLIDESTMLEMYFSFLPNSNYEKRNQCMLGLLLFQGLMRSELSTLEVDFVDFEEERIYIPSSIKTNERYLDLHRRQLEDLKHYIHVIRPILLEEAEKKTNLLFFSRSESFTNGMNNALALMASELKRNFPSFTSISNIRYSRISIWVKNNDLRLAQYFSGIRYASSLDRYKRANTDSLKRKIDIIHPLDNML